MPTRYTLTRAYAGSGALLPATLASIDSRMDSVLRVIGAMNVQPSVVVESVIVPVTSLRDAWAAAIRQAPSAEARAVLERDSAAALASADPTVKAYLLPNRLPWFDAGLPGASNAPVETELTTPLATLTLTTRTFDADLPPLPFSPELCTSLGLSARSCGRFTSARTAISQALINALSSLPAGLTSFALRTGEETLVARGGGGGGGMLWLALLAGVGLVYYSSQRQSGGMSGLGRPPASEPARLRRRAQRARREGRHMKARELERRANAISRRS